MQKNQVHLEEVTRAARLAVAGTALAAALVVSATMLAGLPPLGVIAVAAVALLWATWAS